MLASKQSPIAGPEKKLFYHNDHLGGGNVIGDSAGARVQLTEYDPWGNAARLYPYRLSNRAIARST